MTAETFTALQTTTGTVLADHWDGPGPWWPVFPLLWFALIATVIFFVVRGGRRRAWACGRVTGEQRLAERYAAGEIDEDEYGRRLSVLRRSNQR